MMFERPKAPTAPVLAESPDPVRVFVAGASWAVWPDTWRTGVADELGIPAPGAWTGPEGLGHVLNNLATMTKAMRGRLEQLRQRGGTIAGTIANLRRGGTVTPTYDNLARLGVPWPLVPGPVAS